MPAVRKRTGSLVALLDKPGRENRMAKKKPRVAWLSLFLLCAAVGFVGGAVRALTQDADVVAADKVATPDVVETVEVATKEPPTVTIAQPEEPPTPPAGVHESQHLPVLVTHEFDHAT